MENVPNELVILLGRVRDSTLRSDFGASQKQLDELRTLLGIPEPSSRYVDALTFSRAWQRGTSLWEVAIELGMTRFAASVRANSIRKRGIKLKYYKNIKDSYWDAIKEIINEPPARQK